MAMVVKVRSVVVDAARDDDVLLAAEWRALRVCGGSGGCTTLQLAAVTCLRTLLFLSSKHRQKELAHVGLPSASGGQMPMIGLYSPDPSSILR